MGEAKPLLVGYRAVTPQGELGPGGLLYDYLLARNGVFVRSETELLRATVPCWGPEAAQEGVRGLACVVPSFELPRGKVPRQLLELAVAVSVALPSTEHFFAVAWLDGAYHMVYPEQSRSETSVTYLRPRGALVELHSHREFHAFFSGQDTHDEGGFGLFGVLSLAGGQPEWRFRCGVFGYFMEVALDDIFA